MTRVFIPGANLSADHLSISGPDFHHLAHVLRISPGERISVLDNRGSGRYGVVKAVGKAALELQMGEPAYLPPKPALNVTIAQALGKGDKFEQVIQHGAEIGAHAFIPLLTARTVVKLDTASVPDKFFRWNKVAKGAAEQCGRGDIPEVHPPSSFADLCGQIMQFDAAFLAHADGELLRGSEGDFRSVLLIIGPEGGFSPDEVILAVANGSSAVSLGPYTLRTETAALVALSRLLA